MSTIDLDAYFQRINWRGSRDATRATLDGLIEAHMRAIPFENLDVLLGRPIRLDLPAVEEKMVRRRRGGYCFEHGTLFATVLESLGFSLVRLGARVRIDADDPAATARTHMC